MFRLLALLCCLGLSGLWLPAQVTLHSLASGAWDNPGTWAEGVIPVADDTVVVSSSHTINLPAVGPAVTVAALRVETGATLLLNNTNFIVTGETYLGGTLRDPEIGGNNQFQGHVTLDIEGYFETLALTAANKVVFGGGITHNGLGFLVNRCAFRDLDQDLGGVGIFYVRGSINIGAGVTLTNRSEGGILFDEAFVVGEDSLATLVNRGRLEYRHNAVPMQAGIVDFSQPGNQVIYSRAATQKIYPTTYYDLVIAADSLQGSPLRQLVGPTTVTHQLTIEAGAQLVPLDSDLSVEGEMRVAGVIFDNIPEGEILAKSVVFAGGGIRGSGVSFGRFVFDSLSLEGEASYLLEGDIMMGEVEIGTGQRLVLASDKGEKSFGQVKILGSGMLADSAGNVVTFSGPVDNAGSLVGINGSYDFTGKLLLHRNALADFPSPNTSLSFGVLENDGYFFSGGGAVVLRDSLLGDSALTFSGAVTLAAGATVVNANRGGLLIGGTLDGASAASSLINAGRLVYAPANSIEPPMQTGSLDACQVPGNEVVFAGTKNQQQIPGGCYHHLTLEGSNIKVLIRENLNLKGDLNLNAQLRENSDIFASPALIVNGEGDQTIYGEGEGAVEILQVQKATGELWVEGEFAALQALLMEQGLMRTRANSTVVLSSYGLLTESDQAYVLGRLATERGIGNGQTQRFGGLGLIIEADADHPLGQTLVIRTTGEAAAPGQLARYYEVFPTNNTDLNATVEVGYLQTEVRGADEEDFGVVHAVDGGPFERLGGRPKTLSNAVRKIEIDRLGVLSVAPTSMAVIAYPSPMRGQELTAEFSLDQAEPVDIHLFDRAGRAWYHDRLEGQAGVNLVDLSNLNLAGGFYFLHVTARESKREGHYKLVKVGE